jgi:hypothetical protein
MSVRDLLARTDARELAEWAAVKNERAEHDKRSMGSKKDTKEEDLKSRLHKAFKPLVKKKGM